jgi:hypothetical protein
VSNIARQHDLETADFRTERHAVQAELGARAGMGLRVDRPVGGDSNVTDLVINSSHREVS